MSEVIAAFEGMGAPFEAARTRIELAEWLVADERPQAALPLAQTGLASVQALDLQDWSQRAGMLVAQP